MSEKTILRVKNQYYCMEKCYPHDYSIAVFFNFSMINRQQEDLCYAK